MVTPRIIRETSELFAMAFAARAEMPRTVHSNPSKRLGSERRGSVVHWIRRQRHETPLHQGPGIAKEVPPCRPNWGPSRLPPCTGLCVSQLDAAAATRAVIGCPAGPKAAAKR